MSSKYQVRVSGGLIQGKKSKHQTGEYVSFLGVPYAEPPIGDLRFKDPLPKTPWHEVLDTTKETKCCPQLDMLTRAYIGDEDCLYLNIHTPSIPENSKDIKNYPVMIFIHGGAFLFMSGSSDWFSPDFIVESNVVFVAINYRINALGFLCLDTPEAPGNAGLKDQLLALKWVNENISKFNGDPNNVTVFGLSSGAVSVECHLLSPLSKGLFSKAIMQSGSILNPWAKSRNPNKMAEKLAKVLNINEKEPKKLCELLRNVDIEKLITGTFNLIDEEEFRNCNMFPFAPVIEKKMDGVQGFLTDEPMQLIKEGKINDIPIMAGFCSNEGLFFQNNYPKGMIKNMHNKSFVNFIPSYYNIDKSFMKDAIHSMYNDDSAEENVNNFLSDVHFLSGIYESLIRRTTMCNKDNFFYMFSYEGNINFMKKAFNMSGKGALHADESTYLSFSKYVDESDKTTEDDTVRKQMVAMWTNFAKYGNPTPEKCPLLAVKWQPVTENEDVKLLQIDKEINMVKFPFEERVNMWRSVYND